MSIIKARPIFIDYFQFDFLLKVFEANIRVLGGLLAAHLLIEDETNTFGDLEPDW